MRRGRRRSALPLPKYTRRLPGAGGKWLYYFTPPTWALKPKQADDRGPCPVGVESFGVDYDKAVRRVETVLLPLFEAWRTRGAVDLMPARGARSGTFDWLCAVYRGDEKFKTLGRRVRAHYESGLRLIGDYALKGGGRLGDLMLGAIDAATVDRLYQKLLPLSEGGERRATVNHAMKSARRAWNVARRLHPKDVPAANPFATMGLVSKTKPVEAAGYADLLVAVAQADAMGLPSLGTALMVTWEWLQREEHIFTKFELAHYRPRNRPNEVLIVHPKNGEEVWIPLIDKATGGALFPELMARMDRAKANRVGAGLFFLRDWIDPAAGAPLPWATVAGNLRTMARRVQSILRRAELDPKITFTSFRHGGMTELGDSDLTDAQIRAVSRHKSSKVLPRYVKRTEKQIVDATLKRRANRPAAKADDGQMDLFGAKGGGK